MSNELKVRFWGVRGSYPTPGAGTIKYGGNTASVEIRAGERTIILDAGTGIIPLGRELAKTKHANGIMLLLTHLHHDHTQGFQGTSTAPALKAASAQREANKFRKFVLYLIDGSNSLI